MLNGRLKIRDSVIPDVSVRLLELCLSNDENGIFIPSTQRSSKKLDFRGDWALQEIINERIKKEHTQVAIPLVLRKRELYKKINSNTSNEQKSQKIEELLSSGKTPITLRKLLLYKQSRAG